MTHTLTEGRAYPIGDRYQVEFNLDITSLGSDGTEDFNPDSEFDTLKHVDHLVLGAQEDEAKRITFDHVNTQLDVVKVADGADVGSGTDCGEVEGLAIGIR